MARREQLNYEQRRLLRITVRMPLASVANLASILGATKDRVRAMLGRLRGGGWVSSVLRGMTERRQHRFFLTRQAVDLLYTNDQRHPSPREEARASDLAAFHPEGELPEDFQERFPLEHNHPTHLEDPAGSPFGSIAGPLESVYNLLRIRAAKANTTICRLVLSFLSQFFQSRRHFSSQPKDRSTTHLCGSTAKVCNSWRRATSTVAPNSSCTPSAKGSPA